MILERRMIPSHAGVGPADGRLHVRAPVGIHHVEEGAVEVLAEKRRPLVDDKAREVLFGKTQYERR